MLEPTLGLQPPQRMYTMPEEEVHHFITAEQLNVIKSGGSNHLFHFALTFFGAAFGFVQNLLGLISDVADQKVPPTGEILGAMLFVACVVGAVTLYFSSRSKSKPLDDLIKEIENRQKKPFVVA